MIAYDVFEKYKEERRKIGVKRRYKTKNKIILIILFALFILFFIGFIFSIINQNALFFFINFFTLIVLFVLFDIFIDAWDITDYDDCNDKLVLVAKNIIMKAYNRLNDKSKVMIENANIFMDYLIDYISNLDAAKQKKQDLVGKIVSVFVFPLILGIAYSIFNQFDLIDLVIALAIIVVASIVIIYVIVMLYEKLILSKRREYIRQEFLQILKILKAASINNKSNLNEHRTELLTTYLKLNQTISINQVKELLNLSDTASRNFLNELLKNEILCRCKKGKTYCYSLHENIINNQ